MHILLKLAVLALVVALGGCASVTPTATNARDWLIQYRTGNGLGPVSLDSRLTAFAQAQADAMAEADKLSHDVDGDFASRVRGAGLASGSIAENLAYGAGNEKQAMEQWKGSPAHDRNLLLPKATRFGIASAKSSGAKPRTYWAMVVASDPAPSVPSLAAGPDQGPVVRRPAASSPASGLIAPFASLFSP